MAILLYNLSSESLSVSVVGSVICYDSVASVSAVGSYVVAAVPAYVPRRRVVMYTQYS